MPEIYNEKDYEVPSFKSDDDDDEISTVRTYGGDNEDVNYSSSKVEDGQIHLTISAVYSIESLMQDYRLVSKLSVENDESSAVSNSSEDE